LKLKDIFSAQAKERQKEHGGTAPGKPKEDTLDPKLDQVNKRTLDEIAEKAGLSRGTIHKLETVDAIAPEPIKQAMEAEVISINKAYEATKAAKKDTVLKNQLETSTSENVPQILAKALKEAHNEAAFQKKITDYWCVMSSLKYSETDFELWLSDLDEDVIDTQVEIVDSAVENVLAIQKRLHEIIIERRRPRLVKKEVHS